MFILLDVTIWFAVGVASYVYWETKHKNIYLRDWFFILFFGLCGPFSFVIGWFVHGEQSKIEDIILFKKREK